MFHVYARPLSLRKPKGFSRSPGAFTKSCLITCVLLPIWVSMTAPIRAQVANQSYNLQIGPVSLRTDAGSTVSYNDNINLANNGKQDDFIITPDINIHGLWQATELNVLTFDLGVGYEEYVLHPNDSSPLISPDSQAQFKLFVGDFLFTFADAFSFQNNPTQVGQLSNVSKFEQLSNDASVTADWDVGDLTAELGYHHTNFDVLGQKYGYLDYQSDSISPQVTFTFTKTIQGGLTATVSSTRYDQDVENNSTEFTAGPFLSAQVSENLSVIARGGWVYSDYASGGSNGDSSNIDSFNGSAGITHRINDALTEAVSFGREYLPGLTSNYTDRIYANYTPSWHATSLFDLAPQFWWESLQDSGATVRQTSTRFGAALNIGFTLTQHSTLSLDYAYVTKSSNQSVLNYSQNVLSLGLNYKF